MDSHILMYGSFGRLANASTDFVNPPNVQSAPSAPANEAADAADEVDVEDEEGNVERFQMARGWFVPDRPYVRGRRGIDRRGNRNGIAIVLQSIEVVIGNTTNETDGQQN